MHNRDHRFPLVPESVSFAAFQPTNVNASASSKAMFHPVDVFYDYVCPSVSRIRIACNPCFWADHGGFWNVLG